MENIFLTSFFENVPWRFHKSDIRVVELVAIELSEPFTSTFPRVTELLRNAHKFHILLNDDTNYFLYGWESKYGVGGWLCEQLDVADASVYPDNFHCLRYTIGNIVETFGFDDKRDDLICNMNWVLGSDTIQYGIGEWTEYYNEECSAENKSPDITLGDYIVMAEEANGNLTLCNRHTEEILLFAPDHCFDYVRVFDGCPEYTFYTINGVKNIRDYFELLALQWTRYVEI